MKQNNIPVPKLKKSHSTKIICFLVILQLFGSLSFTNCTKNSEKIPDPISEVGIEEKIETFRSRFNRKRPVIAVIGENKYTELSDFVVPYGVLTRAKIADVYALSTDAGTMQMYPALQIQIQTALSDFDRSFPEGADYVIVPAVHNSENPKLIGWIQKQSSKGAIIVGICDGVWLVANAGLLKGKRATGHWYSLNKLEEQFEDTKWIRNKHYVSDKKIVTTTGVTASIPVSLALIESIAGKEKANSIAKEFGVDYWGTEHKSSDFKFESKHIWIAAKNLLSFWSYEDIGILASPEIDEVTLALVADSYSRTYRTNVFTISNSDRPIYTKGGLILLPEKYLSGKDVPKIILENIDTMTALPALNNALSQISSLYGEATSAFVALQIEYSIR
ncbi:DJ-1/PfpI family protein [Leptospira sp. WS92.C1]